MGGWSQSDLCCVSFEDQWWDWALNFLNRALPACPQLPCPPPPPGRFLRFPGGCYVEGDWLRAAFRWKTALGGNEERPGHFNR
jgi:hypothetical protein